MTDTTAPTLTGLTLPGTVNLGGVNPSVSFSVAATDDVSGIHSVVVFFDKAISYIDATGNVQTGSGFYLPRSSDGSFSITEALSRFASPGTYHVTEVQLQDNAGNLHDYGAADLTGLGLNTAFTLSGGTADTTAPTLIGLTLPGTVNLGGVNPSVSFSVAATDDVSGIHSVVVFFDKAIGYIDATGNVQTGSGFYLPRSSDGSFSITEALSHFASPGTYHVTEVQLQDNAGNLHDYGAADLTGLGLNTAFTLSGGTADTTAPTLTGLTLPGTVNLGGVNPLVSFSVAATDDVSGIHSVVVFFDKAISYIDATGNVQTGSGFYLPRSSDGSFSITEALSHYASPGTYHVTEAQLQDNAGNLHDYGAADLAALGLNTAFTLSGDGIAPPAITSNDGGDAAAVSIVENTTAVTTVTATDQDAGQTLSYSIIGGADAGKFTIGSSTGALSFVTAPNFEAPTDAGGNNVYDVMVQVADGHGGIDTQAIAVTVTDVIENIAPIIFTLTTGSDTITGTAGNDTVNATEATLNSGDRLIGGAGTDTLALYGTGTFRVDQLATFAGFENITINTFTNGYASLYLGNQPIVVTGYGFGAENVYLGTGAVTFQGSSGGNYVYSNSSSNWNAGNSIDGGSYGYLELNSNANIDAYDLTTNALTHINQLHSYGTVTLKINSAVAAGVGSFMGFGTLTTSDAALDLSHSTVTSFTVASSNASGTNFTVGDLGTAFQVAGGSGTDTITAQGFTFTADQRNAIFAAASIEKIVDQTGTYAVDNAWPTISSNGSGNTAAVSIAENTTAVATVTATDPDLGQTLTYSIIGGADAGKFTIGSTTGALSFVTAPNFELPADAGGNNVYDVTVQVADGHGGIDTQAIAVTVTDVIENIAPGNFSLTAGADTVVAPSSGSTVYATAATLSAGDSLTGGAGTDVLALVGSGTFHVDQLAKFTGFERITLDNATNSSAQLYLGGQPIEVDATGYLSIQVNSPSNWNGSDIINGDASLSYSSTNIGFSNNQGVYPPLPVTYDLTSNTFSHVNIYGSADNITLLVNNADMAGVQSFGAGGLGDKLVTAGSTLDLSHTTVSGFTVASTNALGTAFTVGDLGTAFQIAGGSGQDTIVATGFAFSADQRNSIFNTASIEKIVDQTGVYTQGPHGDMTYQQAVYYLAQHGILWSSAADELLSQYPEAYGQSVQSPTTVIEANGSTRLTEVGSHFYFYVSSVITHGNGSGGPSLKYAGADFVAGSSDWAPIGAEQTANGYEVAWKLTGADQYFVWNTDSNGNYASPKIGAVSGVDYALQSLEPSFHQDLNGDGLIGPRTTAMEATGSTSLTEVGNHFFLYDSGGSGPSLKYAGADFVADSSDWAPIGAEQTANGYEVAWKLTGADQYFVWNTDSNGNYASPKIGAVSGADYALQSLEPSFHQDLNGDGLIGPRTTAMEATGSTSLTEVGNHFFLYDSGGSGPSLKYAGADFVADSSDWAPIGAEQTANGYEVAWKLTGADQYFVWNTDNNGNYASPKIGAVSGADYALQSLEPSFHQDLNGDGLIGPRTTAMEATGSTSLTEVGNHFFLYDSGGSGPSLKYAGADFVADSSDWAPIGAEQTANGYEVAWKLTGADQYFVWNTDSNGNYASPKIGAVSGADYALQSLEPSFHQDLNGDGLIGPRTTAMEATGSTSLTEVGNHFFLYDSGGSGPSLKYAGADFVAGSSDWAPIGAEQTANGYEVAWKHTGTDQYSVWNTDSSGNYTSTKSGAVSGADDALQLFEPSFHQDLNGDGVVGHYASVLDGHLGGQTLTSSGVGPTALIGGPNDILNAGAGADTFVFRPDFGSNTINGFAAGTDAIQFDHTIFANVADVQNHMQQLGSDVVIAHDPQNVVTLHDTLLANLHMSDFLIV